MTTSPDTDTSAETSTKSEIELLSFNVGEHEYSVDIMSVREIRGWTHTTSLPHSPSFVRGVINLRGTVLPVLDLDQRLGLPKSEPCDRNVIIVIDTGGRSVGLRVDAVSDILSLPVDALKAPPDVTNGEDETFLKALTIIEDRMVRVLDLTSLLPPLGEAAA